MRLCLTPVLRGGQEGSLGFQEPALSPAMFPLSLRSLWHQEAGTSLLLFDQGISGSMASSLEKKQVT